MQVSGETSQGSQRRSSITGLFKKSSLHIWRNRRQKNVKFSSVSPGMDFTFSKDSNWDPNSLSEDWNFPWIHDPIIYQEYMDHQRDCLNVKSTSFFSSSIPLVCNPFINLSYHVYNNMHISLTPHTFSPVGVIAMMVAIFIPKVMRSPTFLWYYR